MSYTASLYLVIFLPVVIILYSVIPQKFRWTVLLTASYLFFALISNKLLVYLLLSTISIHHIGIWISSLQNDCEKEVKEAEKEARKAIKNSYQHKQHLILIFAVILHVGLLFSLKYLGFFSENLNILFEKFSLNIDLKILKFALPIGISFYTLQAVSYMADVYRGVIKADKNLGRLALFMSFFPQIMEGPICRYSQTAENLYEGKAITYRNMTFGAQRILWGLFKKIIIADRLNVLVETIFNGYQKYNGTIIFVAMICYTCQLYMDFSGTIDVVIGSGEIFGIRLPENFRQPFFSKNVSEFWTRWHISLGAWFKDYVFYPLSLSKPLKKLTTKGRKHLGNHFGPLLSGACALFVVWLCNGIWHGVGWNYIFFGMYYFVLIIMASITTPLSQKVLASLHINKNSRIYTAWQIIRTIVLVNIGELFFRAKGIKAGLVMFSKMFTNFVPSTFVNGTLMKFGLDKHDFFAVVIATLIVLVIGILHEKNIHIREEIATKKPVVRWAFYYALIMSVIIFGAYGDAYAPAVMIYAGF